jgi:hypothetical protein
MGIKEFTLISKWGNSPLTLAPIKSQSQKTGFLRDLQFFRNCFLAQTYGPKEIISAQKDMNIKKNAFSDWVL